MLSKKQLKAIELLLEGELQKQEIADLLKITPTTLSNWQRNNEFIAMQHDVAMKFIKTDMVNELIHNQYDLAIDARSELVRFQATKDLLDRANITDLEEKQSVEVKNDVKVRVKNPFEGKSAEEMLEIAKAIFKDDG